MIVNFKNKNTLIILLLALVIASCLCYISMQKNVETFRANTTFEDYFGSKSYFDASHSLYTLKNTDNKKYILKSTSNLSSISVDDIDISSVSMATIELLLSADNSYNAYKIINETSANLYKLTSSDIINIVLDTSTNTGNPVDEFQMAFVTSDNTINPRVYNKNLDPLRVTLTIDGSQVLVDGIYVGTAIVSEDVDAAGNSALAAAVGGTATSTGGNITLGDVNVDASEDRMNDFYDYLLDQNISDPLLMSQYNAPLMNNFESIMNNPSNPLINPVNSMNPLQYSQSLFGPSVTPMMAKNAHLNSDANESSGASGTNESSGANGVNGTNGANGASGNNLLTQNSNSNTNDLNLNTNNVSDNNSNGQCPPCPSCERCPESNFDCKKIPNYEQGSDNKFLPRAVLTDFSTFGM